MFTLYFLLAYILVMLPVAIAGMKHPPDCGYPEPPGRVPKSTNDKEPDGSPLFTAKEVRYSSSDIQVWP